MGERERERGREPESLKELLCVREWERSAEDRSGFLETVLEESSRWSSRPNTSSREEVAGRGLLSVCLKVDGCPRYHFEATVVENCCMHVLQTRSRRISAHVQLCAQRIHVELGVVSREGSANSRIIQTGRASGSYQLSFVHARYSWIFIKFNF